MADEKALLKKYEKSQRKLEKLRKDIATYDQSVRELGSQQQKLLLEEQDILDLDEDGNLIVDESDDDDDDIELDELIEEAREDIAEKKNTILLLEEEVKRMNRSSKRGVTSFKYAKMSDEDVEEQYQATKERLAGLQQKLAWANEVRGSQGRVVIEVTEAEGMDEMPECARICVGNPKGRLIGKTNYVKKSGGSPKWKKGMDTFETEFLSDEPKKVSVEILEGIIVRGHLLLPLGPCIKPVDEAEPEWYPLTDLKGEPVAGRVRVKAIYEPADQLVVTVHRGIDLANIPQGAGLKSSPYVQATYGMKVAMGRTAAARNTTDPEFTEDNMLRCRLDAVKGSAANYLSLEIFDEVSGGSLGKADIKVGDASGGPVKYKVKPTKKKTLGQGELEVTVRKQLLEDMLEVAAAIAEEEEEEEDDEEDENGKEEEEEDDDDEDEDLISDEEGGEESGEEDDEGEGDEGEESGEDGDEGEAQESGQESDEGDAGDDIDPKAAVDGPADPEAALLEKMKTMGLASGDQNGDPVLSEIELVLDVEGGDTFTFDLSAAGDGGEVQPPMVLEEGSLTTTTLHFKVSGGMVDSLAYETTIWKKGKGSILGSKKAEKVLGTYLAGDARYTWVDKQYDETPSVGGSFINKTQFVDAKNTVLYTCSMEYKIKRNAKTVRTARTDPATPTSALEDE